MKIPIEPEDPFNRDALKLVLLGFCAFCLVVGAFVIGTYKMICQG